MGLDTSYDCWNGPYSAFLRFRNALAVAAGYELVDSKWGKTYAVVNDDRWTQENFMGEWPDGPPEDPLLILLIHSDCDGYIPAKYIPFLLVRLEQLLPEMAKIDPFDGVRGLSWTEATQTFIDGLRKAEADGADIDFH